MRKQATYVQDEVMSPSCSTCRFYMTVRNQGESTKLEFDGTVTRTPQLIEHRMCRRFPKYEDRAPWDWCGERVALNL